MRNKCRVCNRDFVSNDGRSKKCWACQGYWKPPSGCYAYNGDGSIVTMTQAKEEREASQQQK